MEQNDFVNRLLNKHAYIVKGSNEKTTHVTQVPIFTRWTVDDRRLTQFWVEYCEHMLGDEKASEYDSASVSDIASDISDITDADDKIVSIAEMPEEYMPVTVKGILAFTNGYRDTDAFFKALIDCYCDAIIELFEVHDTGSLISCVLISDASEYNSDEEYYIYPFRIQFPKMVIKCVDQTKHLREQVLRFARERHIITHLTEQPRNDWDTIIAMDINEPLALYGSNERQYRPLMLDKVYSYADEEVILTELEEVFDPNEHKDVVSGIINANIFNKYEERECWLPMFLSTRFFGRKTMLKETVQPARGDPNQMILFSTIDVNEDEMVTAERFLYMININKRFKEEAMWLEIGQALCNSGNYFRPNDEHDYARTVNIGFKLWKSASVRSGIRTAEECEERKEEMQSVYFTIRTLAWYARIDNREMFDKWHNTWIEDGIINTCVSDSIDEPQVSDVFWRKFFLKFIYDSKENLWYVFDRHFLKASKRAEEIKKHIYNPRIVNTLEVVYSKFHTKKSIEKDNPDTDERTRANAKRLLTAVERVKKWIGNNKNKIVDHATENFADPDFREKENARSIIGTLSCVIDSTSRYKVITREGKLEDYVTMCTPHHFDDTLTWDSKGPKFVKKLFRQLCAKYPNTQPCLEKLTGTFLIHGNNVKKLPILQGKANAGKSIFKKAVEIAISPQYAKNMPAQHFSSKKMDNGGGPAPHLAQLKGALVAWGQENRADLVFDEGLINEATGDDSTYGRKCNSNDGGFNSTHTLVWICNNPPGFLNPNSGSKERLLLFPFGAEFADGITLSEEEQFAEAKFVRDNFFKLKLQRAGPAILWCMVQWANEFLQEIIDKGGFQIPDVCKEFTAKYWSNKDIYIVFEHQCIEQVLTPDGKKDKTASVSNIKIWNEFKRFFKKHSPSENVPRQDVVLEQLRTRWGDDVGGKWTAIKIKDPEPVNLGGIGNADLGSTIPSSPNRFQMPTLANPNRVEMPSMPGTFNYGAPTNMPNNPAVMVDTSYPPLFSGTREGLLAPSGALNGAGTFPSLPALSRGPEGVQTVMHSPPQRAIGEPPATPISVPVPLPVPAPVPVQAPLIMKPPTPLVTFDLGNNQYVTTKQQTPVYTVQQPPQQFQPQQYQQAYQQSQPQQLYGTQQYQPQQYQQFTPNGINYATNYIQQPQQYVQQQYAQQMYGTQQFQQFQQQYDTCRLPSPLANPLANSLYDSGNIVNSIYNSVATFNI